jgi:hypothetical protein
MSDKSSSTALNAESQRKSLRKQLPDAARGVLTGISANGEPLVDFCANQTGAPVVAATTVGIQKADIGREAILLFEDGDPERPILVGVIQQPAAIGDETSKSVDVTVDGQRLTLSAEQEIVLRCGEASITLTRAGKVLIRGTYLLSRSSGPNRIKGGSIGLN